MHRQRAAELGPRTALRYKQYGLYHDLPWTDYRRQADWAAAGLLDLGVGVGDRIGILSENRYEWLGADIAILSTGAADVTLHAPLSPAQVESQLAQSGVRAVFGRNQEPEEQGRGDAANL